ncbi:hypothetical protein QTJ16_004186 [Diplocarpon rosae]|uniref:Uncharacterized protein n=1 Tax=Diplocarpon rosae TaxID=946125 RepID=A0AAD9T0I9_9HELO|nr:hypothetical protein QTJ16_004186 [Diplocarpon rosae]
MATSLPSLNPVPKKEGGYYEAALRWLEDTYLRWFGENRTSYGVKDSLRKTEITGNQDVDGVQRAVGETVGNTLAEGGVGEGVGTVVDRGLLRR